MAWFLYFMITYIQQFYLYKTTTNIEDITEDPTLFPTVSICNLNAFTTDSSIQLINETIYLFNRTNLLNENVLDKLSLDQFKSALVITLQTTLNQVLNRKKKSELFSLGHKIEDFLIECYFDSIPCNLATDFIWYFDRKYGNCYKYNSNGTKQSRQEGFKNGLGLSLTLFDSMPSLLKRISYRGNGFLIRIDNSTYLADGNNQISLMNGGIKTSVNVERVYSNKLPQPYSNCLIQMDSDNGFQSVSFSILKKNQFRFYIKDFLY